MIKFAGTHNYTLLIMDKITRQILTDKASLNAGKMQNSAKENAFLSWNDEAEPSE